MTDRKYRPFANCSSHLRINFKIQYSYHLHKTPKMKPSTSSTQTVAQLNEASRAHMSEMDSHANDNRESSDEEMGCKSPIFDTFYDDGESIAMKEM